MSRAPSETEVFRAIAEFTYDWETWVDAHGKTRWINPAVERMTGYTVKECMRMRGYPLRLVHRDDRARIAAALEGAGRGTSGNDVELRVVRKDGATRWLAISWQPIVLDGEAFGYRTSVRDIDERKKVEEALRAADRAKSEFLAVMSHEIRSPMHAISGYAQLLDRTELTGRQRHWLDVISRENVALLRIVDDVLDFSALQTGRLPFANVSFAMRDVVSSVLEATGPRAEAKGIYVRSRLQKSVPENLLGDPQRVRQILLNLVDNAVKLTKMGGVTIDVRSHRGAIVTRVTDTGPGIPAKAIPRLFQMFSQVDTGTARPYGGTGLGLAIAKRLCDEMGGTIGVTSEVGTGSSFVFRLPLAAAPKTRRKRLPVPPRALRAEPSLASTHPLRILVVDDSEVALDVACELLRVLGYTADRASNGRAAIAHVRAKPCDLVFLDMQMPDLDGLETARRIRRVARAPIDIVALTANVFVAATDELDAVLTKPLKLPVLQSFLSATLDPEVVQSLVETKAKDGRPVLASMLGRLEQEVARALDDLAAGREGATHRIRGLLLLAGARGLAATTDLADLDVLRDGVARVVASLERTLARARLG